MKKLILIIFTIINVMLPVSAVSAFSALTPACTSGANSATVCNIGSKNIISGNNGILSKITNIIVIVAGIVAVFLIVVAGFMYVTSGGDSQRVNTAKNVILYTVVGLIIIAIAKIIISLVLNHIGRA